MRLKPDMVADWQDIYKTDVVPAYKKAKLPSLGVWSSSQFGDAYEYTLVVPISKFAQYDDESPLVKAMPAEARLRIVNKLSKCVISSHSEAWQAQNDVSIVKEGAALPDLVIVSRVNVQPKDADAYLKYLKEDLRPVVQKAGSEWWLVYRNTFGTEQTQITTVRSLKNWAEIDAGPLVTRLLGPEEGAKLSAKGSQLIESSSIKFYHYMKDLSYIGE